MSFTVRLVHGVQEFELTDGTQFMIEDGAFTPPGAETRLNLSGSGRVIDKQGQLRKFAFQAVALGSSFNQTSALVSRLQTFLDYAGDREPLYLEYNMQPNIPYRPAWGQDNWRRLKIIHGQARLTRFGSLSSHASTVGIELMIEPYTMGLPQVILSGEGGIIEDSIGTVGGSIRGTVVAPTTVNLFTNPIFGYEWAGTWSNGWTFGANVEEYLNWNREYVLFGTVSAHLMLSAATNANVTQSLTATSTSTWVVSAYFKRQDGAAVTDALVKMLYDTTALTTTFVSMGDGWYLAYGTVTGVASAKAVGCQLQATNIAVYATGFMFHAGTFPHPFCYGDMPGCLWGGTPHNNTTTRTAGATTALLSSFIDQSSASAAKCLDTLTIRVALRWWYPSTYATTKYLFSFGALLAYYNATDDKIYMTDGVNTASTAAQTFSAGDLVVLHFVASYGSMKIYKNGVEAATVSAYTPVPTSGTIKLGYNSGTDHCADTFLDFTVWAEAASATHVAVDYADVNAIISEGNSEGVRMNAIPWANDATIDMYQDSTHSDFVTVGGIPGNMPAETELMLLNSGGGKSILLTLNASEIPFDMRGDNFKDLSGTVVAGALGGEVDRAAVNTTEVAFPSANNIAINRNRSMYIGRQAYVFAVIADAGANLTARLKLQYNTTFLLNGDYKAIAADTTRRQFLIGPVIVPEQLPDYYNEYTHWYGCSIYIGFLRSVSGSANVDLDWYRLLIGDVAYCKTEYANTDRFLVVNGRCVGMYNTSYIQSEECLYQGDLIEFEPNKYNYLTILSGNLGAAVVNAGYTIVQAKITPRWKLL